MGGQKISLEIPLDARQIGESTKISNCKHDQQMKLKEIHSADQVT